jgi:HKD family nuclease
VTISKKLTIEWLTGNTNLLKTCNEVNIASALTSDWAIDLLLRNLPIDAKIHILLGIHLPSNINALEKLLNLHVKMKLECRLYAVNFFHPKLYLLKTEDAYFTFIGSGNFTKGGLFKNTELFHKSESIDEYSEYKKWFDTHFEKAKPISKEHLDTLKPYFEKYIQQEQESANECNVIADVIEGKFNIDAINFTNQFFSKEHHKTFSPANRNKESDALVDSLRENTRKRLYVLHDLLLPKIEDRGWVLYPHYLVDDIVSKTELTFQRSHEIGAMWVHYGRSRKEIKAYGEDETPLFFSRLQVIIHYNNIGIWLRFGKNGGSRQDREYFREKMKINDYRLKCFQLLKSLGDNYWVSIGSEIKEVSAFNDENEFWEFTQTDDWRNDYFIIGLSISLGDSSLTENNIIKTIMNEFEKLYPLYLHMKDNSFEKK